MLGKKTGSKELPGDGRPLEDAHYGVKVMCTRACLKSSGFFFSVEAGLR